ncbi:MAG: polysaccharide deacetylase family protein [Candidatus Wallbacteria bacterium]|nr:polysaccharide deacetylase family protein [Candidatus Wallbacteria bacterium]
MIKFAILSVVFLALSLSAKAGNCEIPFSWTDCSVSEPVRDSEPGWVSEEEFPLETALKSEKLPSLRQRLPGISIKGFKTDIYLQSKKYAGVFYIGLDTVEKVVALTFDDGPDRVCTPEILKILKKYDVRATFFLIGENMVGNGEIVKQIAGEGHSIGCHTFNHLDLRKVSPELALKNIRKWQDLALNILGSRPDFIRPPFGAITDREIDFLGRKGYRIIGWSVDTFDWDSQRNSIANIKSRVDRYMHKGAIILMHSSDRRTLNTVQALPSIIEGLKTLGYKFYTIPQMFNFKT